MSILKNFAVFEGGDGSGTTTQIKMLCDKFPHNALETFYNTFEPTDGNIGRLIRQGLRGEIQFNAETIAYLFAADRSEHIFAKGGIKERCERGELVVSDRYVHSSLVYQGITCGDDLPALLNRDFPVPELLLFFDLDPEIAQKRIESRSQKEIYEKLEFQILVRNRYRALLPALADSGCHVEIIDASKTAEEVSAEVWGALSKMPIFKK